MARSRGRGLEFVEVLPEDGERKLMLAVLIDAIRTLETSRYTPWQRQSVRTWQRERAWFQKDDRSRPFAFASICDALGLNADYVRRRVLRPLPMQRPLRVRRYAAKSEEIWHRQRRENRPPSALRQAAAG
jgi:hypothetical protein